MDIFKLFFDHDLRLDKTVDRHKKDEAQTRLEGFMSPTPTFSKFYLTGTRLGNEEFGLNCLSKYNVLLEKLNSVFAEMRIFSDDKLFNSFAEAVDAVSVGEPILITGKKDNGKTDLSLLAVNEESNVGHIKNELREPLLKGHIIIYKEQAKNGFDLHIFSKENIYKKLCYPLKELVDDAFRFFSVNSKRMRSERHFYFEMWTLERPPHGAEEVFVDTEL